MPSINNMLLKLSSAYLIQTEGAIDWTARIYHVAVTACNTKISKNMDRK